MEKTDTHSHINTLIDQCVCVGVFVYVCVWETERVCVCVLYTISTEIYK